jgi:DNA invertase Pin-like site-specific DNA recombinase
MTSVTGTRRVATYERVSSEDQRERETIRTQPDEIARLGHQPGLELVGRYVDDGVSGMVPIAERPDGRRLLADAAAHRFEELWVYKVARLGRDAVDLLVVRRRLDALGIKLVSVVEGQPDLLGYDVQAVVADHYRREFARRSADGMNRAAREGRYCGGIAPLGYRIAGRKLTAPLVPDETEIWQGLNHSSGDRCRHPGPTGAGGRSAGTGPRRVGPVPRAGDGQHRDRRRRPQVAQPGYHLPLPKP